MDDASLLPPTVQTLSKNMPDTNVVVLCQLCPSQPLCVQVIGQCNHGIEFPPVQSKVGLSCTWTLERR